MAELKRYDRGPWDLLEDMRERVGSLFEEMPFFYRRPLPVVDVQERDDAYILEAELPGMSDKDVEVRVEGNVLSISSQKEERKEEARGGYMRRERRSRSFHRSFRLPDDVQHEKIEATFKNGLLTLTLPRSGPKKEKGRRIAIQKP
jgi:HSP20 family protein